MNAVVSGLMLSMGFMLLLLAVAWYVLQAAAYWKIFTKAGEKGWKSLIPVYNIYVQFRLTWDVNMFWIYIAGMLAGLFLTGVGNGLIAGLANFLSLLGFVIGIMSSYKLSQSFGHGLPFALGLVFVGPIFKLILGFGSDRYLGPQ